MKRILKYSLFFSLIVLTAIATYLGIKFPPILAGMASKIMCSCVYVEGRTKQSVLDRELMIFSTLNKAKFEFKDSISVTATYLWETRTSIFRKGHGCTLLAQRSEEDVRSQSLALPEPARYDQDTMAWPMGDQVREALTPDVNYEGVQSAINSAFDEPDPEKPKNTLAVIVVYDGKIVGERYAPGIDRRSRLMGWSMTKSLTNGLIALLVKEGKLRLEAPAPVPEWQSDDRKNITLNNLMQASSGLAWSESYFSPGTFHNMFSHSDDMGAFAASQPLKYPVGSHWEYSSGTTNILSRMVRQTVGDANYPRYCYENLFYKIGMTSLLVEPDPSGTWVGSSYGYACARDWARFGLLYLNDGMWNGERLLPEGWVNYTSTPAPAAPIGQYGAQFWLNAGVAGNPQQYHPGVPNDEFAAEGAEEQNVFIIPSKKLVLVRLGVSHHGFDIEGLTRQVIAALP